MYGSKIDTFIRRPSSGSFLPNDVAIDYRTSLLYYVEDSNGVLKVSVFSGQAGKILVQKSNDNTFIENPRSISLRQIVEEENMDGNPHTDEAELYWSDTGLRAISRVDVITTNNSVKKVQTSNLRNIITKTSYMPYAVQFVSMQGHRDGGEGGEGGEGGRDGGTEGRREGRTDRRGMEGQRKRKKKTRRD